MKMRVDERRVRIRMAEQGINTLEEVGDRSKVATSTMRRMFAGAGWQSGSLEDIALVLECSPLDLLTVKEPGNGKGAA